MFSSKKIVLSSKGNFSGDLYAGYSEALKQYKKSSELIDHYGIEYSKGEMSNSYIDCMKQGYLAMEELNLELSEYGFESYIDDLKEYEASL